MKLMVAWTRCCDLQSTSQFIDYWLCLMSNYFIFPRLFCSDKGFSLWDIFPIKSLYPLQNTWKGMYMVHSNYLLNILSNWRQKHQNRTSCKRKMSHFSFKVNAVVNFKATVLEYTLWGNIDKVNGLIVRPYLLCYVYWMSTSYSTILLYTIAPLANYGSSC